MNDYHWNSSSPAATTFTVTTPPAGVIDPRRIGVRSTGAYWGAAGEQIDTRSGNLSFTLPLMKAQGRGGTGVTFALSYNSQNWRKDDGGTWKLGRDVGYCDLNHKMAVLNHNVAADDNNNPLT